MSDPLTFETMKVGMRVRCIYYDSLTSASRYGKIGRVVSVNEGAYTGRVVVEWEDGCSSSIKWRYASSFELVRREKKFSHVSPKKLRKLEREQMKARAFLNQ